MRSVPSSQCTHCLPPPCASQPVVETMKALLHRFVRICPSCCAADRFRIRLIPDCAGFVAQNGFVAQAKCFRQHNGYRQGMKRPICLQTSCQINNMFHLFIICLNGQKEGFFNCLGKQQLNCVCNNLLWDVCLWCKHWRPQVVVNGRKILRMWQKGSMCQMLLQRTKVALYFPSAELNCAAFALSSTISPSIVLWLWLSHYAKAS